MRWLKFIIYLGFSYVVLLAAIPRAGVWFRLAKGPAGWVPDPPNPLLWATLALLTLVCLLGLIADVGFGLWKQPKSLSVLMVCVLGLALAGLQAESRGRLVWNKGPFDTIPGQSLSAALDRAKSDLGEHYREHRSFPKMAEEVEAMLSESVGGTYLAPYLYRGLRRRPPTVVLVSGATGPSIEIDEGVLPGTFLYALSDDAQAYWLTVVAGSGAPAEPILLQLPGGRPMVVSNLPVRSGL